MTELVLLGSLIVSVIILVWLPLHYYFYQKSKHRAYSAAFVIGFGSFILAYIIKIPAFVGFKRVLEMGGFSPGVFFLFFLLALIASIVDNVIRYAILKGFTPKDLTQNTAVSFGLGFGWCKSFLVGLVLLAMVVGFVSFEVTDYSVLEGTTDQLFITQLKESQAETDPWTPLMISLIRIFEIVIAMSLTVLVFHSFYNIKYLYVAIGAQFVYDFLFLYSTIFGMSFAALIGFILAVSSVWLLLRLKHIWYID